MTQSRTAATFPPPVMEARRWLEGVIFPADRPLINVSQAAPVDPPPEPLRQAIAEIALTKRRGASLRPGPGPAGVARRGGRAMVLGLWRGHRAEQRRHHLGLQSGFCCGNRHAGR